MTAQQDIEVLLPAEDDVALHMQDGANRWGSNLNEHGVRWELRNDRLARKDHDGTPDHSDPSVFPVLWSDGSLRPTQR